MAEKILQSELCVYVRHVYNICMHTSGVLVSCLATTSLWYSSIRTLKNLVCTIAHALHEQQKDRGMFASAREIDDVSATRAELKTRHESK